MFSNPKLRSSQDLTVRPQVFISGIRYDFTPAKRRYNPSYFAGTVEPVIDLQTAFAVRRRESGVLPRASSVPRKGTMAQFNSGDALWHACLVFGSTSRQRFCRLDLKPECHWWNLARRRQIATSWATGTCTGLVPELRGTVEVSSMRRHVVPKLSDIDGLWKGQVCQPLEGHAFCLGKLFRSRPLDGSR